MKLKNGTPVTIDNCVQPADDADPSCRTDEQDVPRERTAEAFHRPLHPPAGAGDRRQPVRAGARHARDVQPVGDAVPEDRERHDHGDDAVLRRQRRAGRRLHHHAPGGRDRPGAGHRLPVLLQRHGRVEHHRVPAPELRLQPRPVRNQRQGKRRSQPAAATAPSSRWSPCRSGSTTAACTSGSSPTRCPPTR